MKIPYPPVITPTNEMLHSISRIDAFRGGWDAGNAPPPDQLLSLRRFATIEFSPLAEKMLDLLQTRKTLTVAEASLELGANRNTVKVKFKELITAGHVRLCGKGRGAHYRMT
ncbi:MAG: hypothetical protein MI807_09230 [Verrucomicrobiales bacterium]|nr:hypothetical protein [Verrucomicrobiales bacterium]